MGISSCLVVSYGYKHIVLLIYAAYNTTAISGNLHLANHRTNATQHYSTTIRRSEKN